MAAAELPIFPLNAVLFPQMLLPLRVFEERYVPMIRAVLAGDKRFGVALIKEGNEVGPPAVPYDIGTIACIRQHQEVSEGQFLVFAVGESRFRILSTRHEEGVVRAVIEALDDSPGDPERLAALVAEVRTAAIEHFQLVQQAGGMVPPLEELPDEAVRLSFYLGASLPGSDQERQELLELTDTAVRLERLHETIRHEIDVLGHRLIIHNEAERIRGGNGRLPNDHLSHELLDQIEE